MSLWVMNVLHGGIIGDHYPMAAPYVTVDFRAPEPWGRWGPDIEARFLIWGLYAGVKPMITFGNYNPVEITLKWDGQVVGYIDILPWTTPRSLGMNHVPSLSILPLETPDGSRSQPDIHFTSYGAPMARSTVVLTILNTLVTLAPNNEWGLVQAFQVSAPPPFEANLKLQPLSPQPSGAEPFEYIYIFHGLQIIVYDGLFHGQWRACKFDFLIDDVVVCKGSME